MVSGISLDLIGDLLGERKDSLVPKNVNSEAKGFGVSPGEPSERLPPPSFQKQRLQPHDILALSA